MRLFSTSVSCFLFCIQIHLCYFSGSTYKQYHVAFVFLWLLLLSIIFSRSTHVAANGDILFYFSMALYTWHTYILHNLFIHSSVDRHLGCFHILAIVNSASMNIEVHVSFQIRVFVFLLLASQMALLVKNPLTNPGETKRCRFDPWVGKILWRRAWQSTPVFLPGESHGQRSLAGYSPWGYKESDVTEQLSLSLFSYQGKWKFSCSVMSDSLPPHEL